MLTMRSVKLEDVFHEFCSYSNTHGDAAVYLQVNKISFR